MLLPFILFTVYSYFLLLLTIHSHPQRGALFRSRSRSLSSFLFLHLSLYESRATHPPPIHSILLELLSLLYYKLAKDYTQYSEMNNDQKKKIFQKWITWNIYSFLKVSFAKIIRHGVFIAFAIYLLYSVGMPRIHSLTSDTHIHMYSTHKIL